MGFSLSGAGGCQPDSAAAPDRLMAQAGREVAPLPKTRRTQSGLGRLPLQFRDEAQRPVGVFLGNVQRDVAKVGERFRGIAEPFHREPARRASMAARSSA